MKEEPYGAKNSFKYFIEYNDNDVIRPLRLPQIIGYVRKFEGNTTMSFKIVEKATQNCWKSTIKYGKELKKH